MLHRYHICKIDRLILTEFLTCDLVNIGLWHQKSNTNFRIVAYMCLKNHVKRIEIIDKDLNVHSKYSHKNTIHGLC